MTDPEKTTQIPSKLLGQLLSGDLREGRCRLSEGYNLGGFNIGESAGFWLRSCNTPVIFSHPYISRSGAAIKARPEFNSFCSYDNAGYMARGSGLDVMCPEFGRIDSRIPKKNMVKKREGTRYPVLSLPRSFDRVRLFHMAHSRESVADRRPDLFLNREKSPLTGRHFNGCHPCLTRPWDSN